MILELDKAGRGTEARIPFRVVSRANLLRPADLFEARLARHCRVAFRLQLAIHGLAMPYESEVLGLTEVDGIPGREVEDVVGRARRGTHGQVPCQEVLVEYLEGSPGGPLRAVLQAVDEGHRLWVRPSRLSDPHDVVRTPGQLLHLLPGINDLTGDHAVLTQADTGLHQAPTLHAVRARVSLQARAEVRIEVEGEDKALSVFLRHHIQEGVDFRDVLLDKGESRRGEREATQDSSHGHAVEARDLVELCDATDVGLDEGAVDPKSIQTSRRHELFRLRPEQLHLVADCHRHHAARSNPRQELLGCGPLHVVLDVIATVLDPHEYANVVCRHEVNQLRPSVLPLPPGPLRFPWGEESQGRDPLPCVWPEVGHSLGAVEQGGVIDAETLLGGAPNAVLRQVAAA
mmetsp:Transcript_108696/g.232222  ORF Transcript_108696/g.232222 Transcript_108696/m.232222 type:complete len:402 (-) Transcript_108696:775-1980(-)